MTGETNCERKRGRISIFGNGSIDEYWFVNQLTSLSHYLFSFAQTT